MNQHNHIFGLRLLNLYDFCGPNCENVDRDTNIAVADFMRSFVLEFKALLKYQYPIVIQYNNDVYSILAYRLIKNTLPITTVKPKVYLYGNLSSDDEKTMFKETEPISLKKIKKMKKAIYVDGYHPTCNVEIEDDVSKYFKYKLSPLKRFTPAQLNKLNEYYLSGTSLYKEDITGDCPQFIKDFYAYPISLKNLSDVEDVEFDMTIPIIHFDLKGTEEDFEDYDRILKHNEEKNVIFLYTIPEDKIDFVKTNLGTYLPCRNVPNELNIVEHDVGVFLQHFNQRGIC